ncbi:MAG TPA: hypothetical protein PLN93_00010 [Vicinamibacterales bacterium]|nr:hypothetical protein [Vicinamibacterales bacterium]
MSIPQVKAARLPGVLLAVMVAAVLAFAWSGTAADPDLWGHVRFGQDILAARAIPRADPYSFTSDRPWINHEWLSEAIMAAAYGLGGSAGLVGLKLVIAAVAFAILWRALRRAGVHPPAVAGLVVAGAVGAYGLMLTVRPQLVSMLLYVVLLALLNEAWRGRCRALLWMPLLFAAWANAHGGWIVGIGVLAAWGACAAVAGRVPPAWAAGSVILALAGTLVTPYGTGLWRFLWETVGFGRADITEWQPASADAAFLAAWAAAASLVAIAWHLGRRAALPLLVPAILVGVAAFRVSRLGGFFALTNVLLLAPCFAGRGPARLPLSRAPTARDLLAVGALCLAGLAAIAAAIQGRIGCVTLALPGPDEQWAPEAQAVQFLRDNPIRGRLLTYFDYGEIAIWHLAPRVRVSYDGRRETVYSEAVQQAHRRFYSKSPNAEYARQLGADYIWLPHRLPVVGLLERDGWVAIFRGARSIVLARAEGAYTQPDPWTGLRCFPGP